jgi:hypothetical protein
MQCKFVKPIGGQCGANALKTKYLCYFHSQDRNIKKLRFRASSKGGRNYSTVETYVSNDKHFTLTTIGEVLSLLEFTTNNLLQGKITRGKASCIGYLSNIMLSVIKDNSFEGRPAKPTARTIYAEVRGQK